MHADSTGSPAVQVKLFVKKDCSRCPSAKRACEGITEVQMFDLGDIDGLAEAAFYNVMATPTVLVLAGNGSEIASWRGEAPEPSALRDAIAGTS